VQPTESLVLKSPSCTPKAAAAHLESSIEYVKNNTEERKKKNSPK